MSFDKVQFGDICDFVRGPFGGSLKKDSFVSEGYAIYEQQHAIYNQFDCIRYFISGEKFQLMKRFELKEGDLIMSCSGTMGKVAIVPKGISKGIINQALLKISPSKKVDIHYLKYWMESESFQNSINNTNGSAIQNVSSVKILKEVELSLPPLATQKQIAAVLEKAAQLRKDCQKMEDELNCLAQSMFIKKHSNAVKILFTFGDLALKEKNSFVNGPFGSNLLSSELTSEGVPVLYIRDIASGVFKRKKKVYVTSSKALELNTCRVDAGDVLVAKVGDPPGTAAIYPKGEPAAIVTQDVIRIKCNDLIVIAEYLIAYFNSALGVHALKAITVEATRSRIGLGDLKKLNVELPNIDEQMKFVKLSRQVTKLLNENKNLKQQYEDEFNALMQKAFKGELNLNTNKM